MEDINIVSIVNRELRNRKINHASVARKLNTSQSTIRGMLTRSTLQVKRLLDLSAVCDYNFFREIAELLPYTEPLASNIQSAADTTNVQNERIKELEMEVKILRQTIKDIVGK
jgi:hypothetical protein